MAIPDKWPRTVCDSAANVDEQCKAEPFATQLEGCR
jgi:hypothetical protein